MFEVRRQPSWPRSTPIALMDSPQGWTERPMSLLFRKLLIVCPPKWDARVTTTGLPLPLRIQPSFVTLMEGPGGNPRNEVPRQSVRIAFCNVPAAVLEDCWTVGWLSVEVIATEQIFAARSLLSCK
jgi:hypothetical protein